MKLLEFEAKEVFGREGIRIPKGVVVRKGEDLRNTDENRAGSTSIHRSSETNGCH